MKSNIRFAFFGTSHIAVMVLDELEKTGLVPSLIITMPEKKMGRGLQSSRTAVADWANFRGLRVSTDWTEFEKGSWDVAIVVDYGKILPLALLAIPKRGFLNVHPSLLPRLRGASPMRSALLAGDTETGVTVMLVDEEMDHGPIVAQKKIALAPGQIKNSELEKLLMPLGGELLARILPEYVAGNIITVEQNHDVATYSGRFSKDDGLLDLSGDAEVNLRKILAFETWPGTYTFFERAGKRIRVAILSAHIENGALSIDTVKPEGKNEMPYAEFLKSGAKPA